MSVTSINSGHQKMVSELADLALKVSDDNPYYEDKTLRVSLDRLSTDNLSDESAWELKYNIARTQFRLGREEEAIRTYEELLPSTKPGNTRTLILFRLGVAYLRLAETQNCCQRYTKDSCVFPIRGLGIHEDKTASRKAIEHLTATLFGSRPESQMYHMAIWLLNIAHMTVGTYPDDVPREFLIPPDKLESSVAFPKFENISIDVGLGSVSLAGGVVADDFDGNGMIDFLVSDWHPTQELKLFMNRGNRQFPNLSEQSGLQGILGGLNMVQADYDNDGRVDVLVLRGAWFEEHGCQPNSLLKNLGDGRFIDVTFDAGLASESWPTQTAAWGDFDNDGFLDLYVGNESSDKLQAPSQLFRNNGDGTFTDVAKLAGVTNDRFAKAVVWGDINTDDFPDLFVSNLGEPNRLYRNNGDGTFSDVAGVAGVERPLQSFPSWFWDVDNDGDIDLFVSAYAAGIDEMSRSYLGKNTKVELAKLYLNDGRGRFTDVAKRMNLTRPNTPMGANFGDLDNDGYLDFYLGTGDPPYYALMPNVMFWNRGGIRFEDVTFTGGVR